MGQVSYTYEDALQVAERKGREQYWLDYRIVYTQPDGSYNCLLTSDQDWYQNLWQKGCNAVSFCQRDNTQPSGFSNWTNVAM